ncbi:MAG: hypothetical protein ACN4GK_04830 [Acidimicrobiia bacterium]
MSRVWHTTLPPIALVLILTACADQAPTSSPPTVATVEAVTTAPAVRSTTTTAPAVDEVYVPDYAALIAAVESAMEGTSYAGAALEDPEVFIATAELFCDLLAEGMTKDQLLAEYLVRLSDDGAIEVDEDDGLMAGVLLGAATEIVCPRAPEETP